MVRAGARHSPDFIDALNNKALLLGKLHRFDEAQVIYRRVMALDPANAEAELGLGHLHLLTGNFEAGWAGHQARFKMSSSSAYPKFAEPMWSGEAEIAGKTILIHVDEGLGDTIQFARYVPEVAARGARVILVVADALHPLLSGLPGVSACVPLSAASLPAFDMHLPDVQPADDLRNAARYDSVAAMLPGASAAWARASLGRPPRPA